MTALVRDNEKARARREARRASGGRQSRGARVVPRRRRRAGRLRARGLRLARPAAGRRSSSAALETIIAAAQAAAHRRRRRARRSGSSSTRRASGCSAGRRSRRPKRRRSTRSPLSGVPAGARAARARRRATTSLRTIVVRPGVVYGGGDGIVGDLFKAASNGLVRVVGDGNNHWPLVYDRDLADLYARLAAHRGRGRRLPRQRRRRRARQRHRRRDRAVPAGAARRAPRADRGSARTRWARTPTRWRSIRWSAARGRERSAGRRRCIRSPATPRGCSKSGASREIKRCGRRLTPRHLPAAVVSRPIAVAPFARGFRFARRWRVHRCRGSVLGVARHRLRLGQLARDHRVDQAVFERVLRVEVEVGALGVPDDLAQRLAGARRQDLVDLILHLLQALEMLGGGASSTASRPTSPARES